MPFFVVIGLYIVLMAGIGIYATRHTNTMQDYFVLSGKAGFIVSGIAYATTQYSMGTFLGTPGTIYGIGYAGMGINVPGVAFSLVIPAIFIGRRLVTLGHREGFLTLSDYLSDRYENKKMSGVLGVIGPSYLNYSKIIPHIEYFTALLGNILSGADSEGDQ